jgi:hypothetical protein
MRHVMYVTIPAGQSLSDVINLTDFYITGMHFPAAWIGSAIGFLASLDGVIWSPFGMFGEDLRPVEANFFAAYPLANASYPPVGDCWLRIRSGSNGGPIVQSAERRIGLLLRKV